MQKVKGSEDAPKPLYFSSGKLTVILSLHIVDISPCEGFPLAVVNRQAFEMQYRCVDVGGFLCRSSVTHEMHALA